LGEVPNDLVNISGFEGEGLPGAFKLYQLKIGYLREASAVFG
jgi:hypothetical protein